MTLLVFGLRDTTDAERLSNYQKAGYQSLLGTNFHLLAGPQPGTTLEGAPLDKFVILEFPTREEAEAWYHSPAYQAAKELRMGAVDTFAFIIERNP